ncbi:MAG: hypothetical protein ABI414_07255 [Devosia sp.]
MSVLLIHSHFGSAPQRYAELAEQDRIRIVRDRDLAAGHFHAASGLITGIHLDQDGLFAQRDALQALLDRGGRLFFNGHVMRSFVAGLVPYVPIERPNRASYALTRLSDHPIFSGVEQRSLEENRGVAGFYGRGHNPMPVGARAINGIGPSLLPIDWEWTLPRGGKMFCHAGNDMGGMSRDSGHADLLMERVAAWCAGEIG